MYVTKDSIDTTLKTNYENLAVGIVKQTVVDYCMALCGIRIDAHDLDYHKRRCLKFFREDMTMYMSVDPEVLIKRCEDLCHEKNYIYNDVKKSFAFYDWEE